MAVMSLMAVVAAPSWAQGGSGAPQATGQADLETLFEIGRKAMAEKDLSTAYDAFERISRLQPDNPEPLYQMAVVHFLRRDYSGGIPLIERSVALAPENLVLRFSYARALKEAGDNPLAIEQYAFVKGRLEPGSSNWLEAERQLQLLNIKVYVAQADVEGVERTGQILLDTFPDNPAVLNSLGLAYLDVKQYEAAEQLYLKLRDLRPDSALPPYYLGVIYETLKRYDEAEERYQASLRIDRDSPVADTVTIKLGLISGLRYYDKGDHTLAKQEFESVIKQDPLNVVAAVNLSALYIDEQDYEQAISLLAPLIRRMPDNIDARLRLGTAYMEVQRLVESVRELDYVVQHATNEGHRARANELLQGLQARSSANIDTLRELAAEQSIYEDVLAKDEADDTAQLGMAEVLFRQRRIDEAQVGFLRTLELNPYNPKAHKRLATILDSQRKPEEAIEHYMIALSLFEDEDEIGSTQERVWGYQARYFLEAENYEEAERLYATMLARNERNPAALWGVAMTKARAGELEEAVAGYQALLEHYPKQHTARTNLALLMEQLGREGEAIRLYQTVLQERGISDEMRATSTRRLRSLKRRINGLAYNVGYSMFFDDNASLSEDNKLFEYRSATSAQVAYNYKLSDRWRFAMDMSPTYTIYHQGQFDFVSLSASPRLDFKRGSWNMGLGWDHFSQSGLLRPDDSRSVADTITLDGAWRRPGKPSYQLALVYRQFESQSSPFFDAENLSVRVTTGRLLNPQLSVSFRYAFADNENTQPLGNDYAYFGHDASTVLNVRYGAKFSFFGSMGLTLNLYKNPDSSTEFEDKRRNWAATLAGGGSYRVNDVYTIFGNYSLNVQRSNLPVGFVLNELQAIQGLQSASLGSFDRQQISFGVRVNF